MSFIFIPNSHPSTIDFPLHVLAPSPKRTEMATIPIIPKLPKQLFERVHLTRAQIRALKFRKAKNPTLVVMKANEWRQRRKMNIIQAESRRINF